MREIRARRVTLAGVLEVSVKCGRLDRTAAVLTVFRPTSGAVLAAVAIFTSGVVLAAIVLFTFWAVFRHELRTVYLSCRPRVVDLECRPIL